MENALIFYQILSTHSLRKCMETSLGNLYMDIGVERVSPFSPNSAQEKKIEGNDKYFILLNTKKKKKIVPYKSTAQEVSIK